MKRHFWVTLIFAACLIAGCGGSNTAAPQPQGTASPVPGGKPGAITAHLVSQLRYVHNPVGQFVFLYTVHIRAPMRYVPHIILGIDGLNYWRLWKDPIASPPNAPLNGQPQGSCGRAGDTGAKLLARTARSATWNWGWWGSQGSHGPTLNCTVQVYVSTKENPPPVPPEKLTATLYSASKDGGVGSRIGQIVWDGFINT